MSIPVPRGEHTRRDSLPAMRLIPTQIDHGPVCGERIQCPRDHADLGPYHPAERQVRQNGTYILCHVCGSRWEEAA